MAATQLASLYQDLRRSFDAQPSDLKKCGVLLAQLKVSNMLFAVIWSLTIHIAAKLGLIETGLLIPQGQRNLDDLVVARRFHK
jgi:26S proteasome regulatory subunit N12